MITFEKFNETANYYSRTSRTTGRNVWNQDEIQRQFSELIVNCDSFECKQVVTQRIKPP